MASADSPSASALPPPTTEHVPTNTTYFLPGSPPPHLHPSATHQPETLLMQTLLDTLATIVTQILNHPMIDSPVPDHHLFNDGDAYRLYYQYHRSVVELARNTARLKRASRLLQFVPGPPGLPGRYRVNPLAQFPPNTTDFLADEVSSYCPALTRRLRHQSFHPSARSRTTRDRSRSRDRSAS